jgi:hypothetical protein
MAKEQLPSPASWADDLNSYRATRGSRALSSVQQLLEKPIRMTRTSLMPFGNPSHPYFSYQDPQILSDKVHEQQAQRNGRHGAQTRAHPTFEMRTMDTKAMPDGQVMAAVHHMHPVPVQLARE